MTVDLESRLRAAGDEIDRQIDRRRAASTLVRTPAAGPRRPVWTLIGAACVGALLTLGLVWLTADDVGQDPASPVGTTIAAPVTTAVTAPPTTTVPTTVAPTTLAPIEIGPVAVGESVMIGAVPQLKAGGLDVYADESVQGDQMASLIGQLRAAGHIGRTVVIQVGTNGPVSAATYDQIMSYLPEADVPRVVFLTVRAPGKSWIDANNELIWALPSRYPNVTVLEWKGLVDSGQIPGMAGDGVHLGTETAKQAYANYIFETIGRSDLVRPVT